MARVNGEDDAAAFLCGAEVIVASDKGADEPAMAASNIDQEAGRRKVLHVFDHSFPINDGYAFRSAEIIRSVRGLGWRTLHVTSVKQGSTCGEREVFEDLEFFRTRLPATSLRHFPVLDQWRGVRTLRHRLEELVDRERPALLHVHSPCLNGIAALPVARRFDVPVVYEVRALWEDGAVDKGDCREGGVRYRVSRMLETYVCRRADHVVTICEGLRDEIAGRGIPHQRISVVPNSVDLKRFHTNGARDVDQAVQLGLAPGKTFGFIGSFFPYEGLDVLVRAIPRIREQAPEARFVFVGDGADSARIKSLAQELSVEDVTVFTGRVPHVEVERYYDLIDILVYPRVSKRVTELVTPLKPLEAMAQGKLVIASDVGGHREMVFPGKNGLLFKADQPDSLADTALELLSRGEEWESLRANGRRYVEQSRNWNQSATIYHELYGRVLAKARRRIAKA